MTNIEKVIKYLGWQGGTVHQASEATGISIADIIGAKDIDTLIGQIPVCFICKPPCRVCDESRRNACQTHKGAYIETVTAP